jgi:uncharacterized metal-binding protein
MNRPLRAMPVFFACRGCERDKVARDVVAELDRRGLGEAYVAGAEAARARARYPVCAIEGCGEACATKWLAGIGVTPAAIFVLRSEDAKGEAERLAALLP